MKPGLLTKEDGSSELLDLDNWIVLVLTLVFGLVLLSVGGCERPERQEKANRYGHNANPGYSAKVMCDNCRANVYIPLVRGVRAKEQTRTYPCPECGVEAVWAATTYSKGKIVVDGYQVPEESEETTAKVEYNLDDYEFFEKVGRFPRK